MFNINTVCCEKNFDISAHTTYGLGSRAKIAFFPDTDEEAIGVFDYVKKNFERFFVLGNGSNILASNSMYDGAVICTARLSSKIYYNDGILNCQSGISVGQLMKFCLENGITGLEYLAGIPASIGGLALMNGGINSRHIGDDIESVSLYDGNLLNFDNKTCDFGYKHSTMRNIKALILNVKLHCGKSTRATVQKNIENVLKMRSFQPRGKSCGCVFKNYYGQSAGMIIEKAGLKGLTVGSAVVSPIHANFIINSGKSSDDVYKLINEVKRKVFEVFGIKLEEEVVYIGNFNETDV